MGLRPGMLHGAGPQIDDILESEGAKPEHIDGIRVTGAFTATPLDPSKYGLVGEVARVDKPPLDALSGRMPCPSCNSLAESNGGQILNVNADVAAGELAKELEPMKVVFLNVINLGEEYDQLVKEPWINTAPSFKLREFKDLLDLQRDLFIFGCHTLIRRGAGKKSVAGFLSAPENTKQGEWSIYADESLDAVGIESHPKGKTPMLLTTLLASRSSTAHLDGFDFSTYCAFICSPPAGEEMVDRSWHIERAEGSFTRPGHSLFWYGISDVSEVEKIVKGLEASDRVERAYLPLGPADAQLGGARSTAAGVGLGGTRGFATLARRAGVTRGVHQVSPPITHTNLSVEDLERIAKEDEVESWVMALPTSSGVCKPFMDAVERRSKGKEGESSVVVDLGADYRFEEGWTYGLPELYGRTDIRSSKRISNPCCYATSTQLVAHLLPYLSPPSWPIVFGVSGYSSAGTITQPSGGTSGDRPATLPKVTPETLAGGVRPYLLTDHIHEGEAAWHPSRLLPTPTSASSGHVSTPKVQLGFIPTIGPFFSGILSTLSSPLCTSKLGAADIASPYALYYAGDRRARVQKSAAALADVHGKHGWGWSGVCRCTVGGREWSLLGAGQSVGGATTQCLQDLNLTLGYEEYV
ncbi:hypothetical protein BU15DRAFT_68601 [Melanogaster broomeanus]|nr:hypothetical protein BU15DRAFT_68601 [Melanogaster broomeanus]